MLLTHNLPQPNPLALPAQILLYLTNERLGPSYRHTLWVGVDGKEVGAQTGPCCSLGVAYREVRGPWVHV